MYFDTLCQHLSVQGGGWSEGTSLTLTDDIDPPQFSFLVVNSPLDLIALCHPLRAGDEVASAMQGVGGCIQYLPDGTGAQVSLHPKCERRLSDATTTQEHISIVVYDLKIRTQFG